MDLEKYYAELQRKLVLQAQLGIENIYDASANEIAFVIRKTGIKDQKTFRWSKNLALEKRIDSIIGQVRIDVESSIAQNMIKAWNLANVKNDKLVLQYLNAIQKNIPEIRNKFMQTNLKALTEFVNRKEAGMNLSDRVWNLGKSYKNDLEFIMGTGIGEGKSAASLATVLKKFLNEPDKVFRRVRDPKTGKLKLSNPAKNYHPGEGVYRSSKKNALRLTVSEVNMSNAMSDHTRRQQIAFIQSFTVHLSGQHPRPDICDDLKGDYPKDFIFRKWHPFCFCYSTSKLMTKDEFLRYLETGEVNPSYVVNDIPEGMKNWIANNEKRMENWKSKPYFILDNFKKI